MIRLTTLAVLFLSCSADPRSPRIYNVLITSKNNLSPSHAQPVYEPVLRTTSIGYAFPPLLYHTSFVQSIPPTYINPVDYSHSVDYTKIDSALANQNVRVPQAQEAGFIPTPEVQSNRALNSNIALPNQPQQVNEQELSGQFISRDNPIALNYIKYIPKGPEGESAEQNKLPVSVQQEDDPKNVIANLRKNSEIPDVPPPPLPVKIRPNNEKLDKTN